MNFTLIGYLRIQIAQLFSSANPVKAFRRHEHPVHVHCVAALILLVFLSAGCSAKRFAVNTVGDLLASGDSVYESDDDLILVGDALPFSLKLVESLLAESPNHRGLLLTASRGFVLYAYAYVHFEADKAALDDFERAVQLRNRARRLYLRALSYAQRGLEVSFPGFSEKLSGQPQLATAMITGPDADKAVPLLYWSAAALGLAISVSKNEAAMLARLPEVEALLARAMELDETWNAGALHEFQVTFAAAGPGSVDYDAIRKHYQRALELSQGNRAGLHVAYAEAVSIPTQNRALFDELIDNALAVDIDVDPDSRLVNALAQRRAEWLKQRAGELFL